MSAFAEQLAIAAVIPPKVMPLRDDVCRCGHSADHHADLHAKCLYGMSTRRFDPATRKHVSGACDCKRFKSKKRATGIRATPTLERPAAAVDWYRGPPELVRRKLGGWFLRGPTTLRAYLANTKIESYNATMRKAGAAAHFNPQLSRQLIAGDANKRKAQAYRLEAALEQARVEELGAPKHATIIRIGSPRIKDDDNLVPSVKHLRDSIAGALGFDDSRFCIGGDTGNGGDIPIFYRQQTAGARKAYAVLVEITWEA